MPIQPEQIDNNNNNANPTDNKEQHAETEDEDENEEDTTNEPEDDGPTGRPKRGPKPSLRLHQPRDNPTNNVHLRNGTQTQN